MKTCISSASAKLKSVVKVLGVSPVDAPTCGWRMTVEQARSLATNILAVAEASNAKGVIYLTGRPSERNVTIIRKIK